MHWSWKPVDETTFFGCFQKMHQNFRLTFGSVKSLLSQQNCPFVRTEQVLISYLYVLLLQYEQITVSPCINYMPYPWVISSVPVSHILSTCESYPQYPWVISSAPVRICSTRESYHQYPWVISSVPVRICSARESYHQYPWVISSVPVRICSTYE